jgi:hypothetical protein
MKRPADAMKQLQQFLKTTGRYAGNIDGIYGPKTRAACLNAMTDGPDTPLGIGDYKAAAKRLGVRPAYILAFADVEANGAGFEKGKPKILFEPHRFSKLTRHQFDRTNPQISYPVWGTRRYPATQNVRYSQLLDAIGLDAWAGFCAASYGKFQILGENYDACGYASPWAFAIAMGRDEQTQLKAFESFIRKNGILGPLKVGLWESVAAAYNGSAYRANQYDVRLAKAAAAWEKRLA